MSSKLQTARTIGGVSFNGTSNIDLPGVNQGGNQDTTGNAATATSATNASNVYVAQENTNDTRENRFLTFVDGTDDNKQLRSKSALYYKPAEGRLFCGIYRATSDRKMKENIVYLNSKQMLENVNKIHGVSFNFINSTSKNTELGVVAQDIEELFPELVDNDNSYKSVNYNGFVGPFIECIKELTKQNQLLEERIRKLENK